MSPIFSESVLSNPGFEPPFVSVGAEQPDFRQRSDRLERQLVLGGRHRDLLRGHQQPARRNRRAEVDVQAVTSGAVQLVEPVTVNPALRTRFAVWLRGQAGMSCQRHTAETRIPAYTYCGRAARTLSAELAAILRRPVKLTIRVPCY